MTETTETAEAPETEADDIPRLCTLKPLGGQVIIKRDPPVTVTKGGILLPDPVGMTKKVCTGTVICKGPGHVAPQTGQRISISDDIKPGSHVMFMEHAGGDYPHEEAHGPEVYTLMQEAEIVCVIGGPDNAMPIPAWVASQDELTEAQKADAEERMKQAQAARKRAEAHAHRVANQLQGKSSGGIVRPR